MQAPTWSVATVQEAGRSCRRGRASAARGPLLPSVKAKFSAQSQLMWSDAFGFISSSESLDTMHNRPGVTCMYQYVPQTLSTYVQSLPEMQSRNREHRVTSTLETGCDFGQKHRTCSKQDESQVLAACFTSWKHSQCIQPLQQVSQGITLAHQATSRHNCTS